MVRRRRQYVEDQQPLGPEDDPYLAYLAWRAERDAEPAAEVADTGDAGDAGLEPVAAAAGPARTSWIRRLAVWRRDDDSAP